jgi:multiple sugar transport system substrate-binding protein
MMKNLMMKCCVVLATLVLLVACAPAKEENVQIKFMNYSSNGGNEDALEAMVKAFEDQNPTIDVVIETYGYNDYFTQLATRVAGDQAPDVFELNIENFRAYADKGAIAELDSVLEDNDIDVSLIHPKALSAFQIDGKQYGLPTKFSNVVLIYNKDLFDQAGIAYPTEDWTWDEELAAAQKIRALGDDIYGIFRPVQTWEFYKTVVQNGGAMMNADQSEFTLNSAENIEALSMMVDRINVSNVTPTTEQMSGIGDWDLFISGRLGMIVTGIWAFGKFTTDCTFDWDIAVEPGIEEHATHFFSDALVVSADSAEKDAAALFSAFIAGSEESAKLRVEANWDLPVVLSEDVIADYMAVTPPANKQAVFDSLDYLVMPPSLEKFSAVADDLQVYLSKAISGELTAKEALDQAQATISAKY